MLDTLTCPITVGKDGEKCRTIKIGCYESFLTTLVGKDGEKCETIKIGHSESFWTTLVGKEQNGQNWAF